jgi:hypothetical protein
MLFGVNCGKGVGSCVPTRKVFTRIACRSRTRPPAPSAPQPQSASLPGRATHAKNSRKTVNAVRASEEDSRTSEHRQITKAKFRKSLRSVPPVGLDSERVTANPSNDLGNSQIPSGAESGAFPANSDLKAVVADPDLVLLIDRWPSLTPTARSAILSFLKTLD